METMPQVNMGSQLLSFKLADVINSMKNVCLKKS